ncbi:alpha/beta hydrolase [Yeosuana sp. MJ-SS3]|uniref:Alpha/beta hydrolase n=1 Tax=Gilvirhabdus luticola TaxID=3079858 RepID=A0ABU3U6L8_9FLAO|nr:alpha/beta hydrolase [Yeosuana sp. MJ-SS3]MDU8885959.1 alpha/beta hydrolase [Yeosuana sp. MJ-SS3]
MKKFIKLFIVFICYIQFCNSQSSKIFDLVEHHYADNKGVKIHYVSLGKGPVVLFVHGFPDFWYTWHEQMLPLSKNYKTVAVDLRGYNLSDSPKGVENYFFNELIGDIEAVIKSLGEQPVHLVGHDWGAAISWRLAIEYPELIKKLVILNVPHPKAGNNKPIIQDEERQPSYADTFVSDEFRTQLTEQWLSGWVKDSDAKSIYIEAFKRSDKDVMINYYKANYPTLENLKKESFIKRNYDLPNLKMPVLIVHGKNDKYLPISGHNNTWDFTDNELTIEILPNAGHFVQQDESEKLTKLISEFLERK